MDTFDQQKTAKGFCFYLFLHRFDMVWFEVFFSFCSDQQLNLFPLWIAGITLATGLFAVPMIAMANRPVEA